MTNENVTAAILVIGDEILSGRTKDKNVGHMAELLTLRGIDLREVRFVPDVQDEIVAAVNALRARWTYVFTTGGIGPTHDDITADAIAAAFGVGIDVDPRARALLLERIKPEDLNEARLRMARTGRGGGAVLHQPSLRGRGLAAGRARLRERRAFDRGRAFGGHRQDGEKPDKSGAQLHSGGLLCSCLRQISAKRAAGKARCAQVSGTTQSQMRIVTRAPMAYCCPGPEITSRQVSPCCTQ